MHFVNTLKIGVKLPLMLVALSMLALTVMGVTSYREARNLLEMEAHHRLESARDERLHALERWSEQVQADLRAMAANQAVGRTMRDLMNAWKRLGEGADARLRDGYVTNNPNPPAERYKLDFDSEINDFSMLHRREHPGFVTFAEQKGIYDIFFIRPDAEVLYTLRKDERFAANLRDPALKDSALAQLFEKVLKDRKAPPETSGFVTEGKGAEAQRRLYLAVPLRSAEGVMLGVLAISTDLAQIAAVTADPGNLGESGYSYIVDGTGALQNVVRGLPQVEVAEKLSTTPVAEALAGQTGSWAGIGLDGAAVQSTFAPLALFGAPYALVVEQSEAELFGPATQLAQRQLFNAGWLTAVLAAMSIWMARSIARPLRSLGAAVSTIAGGDHATHVPGTSRGDEVGGIAKALDALRDDLERAEAAQREATIQGTAFRNSSAALILLDADLRLTYANDAMAKLVGERPENFREHCREIDPAALVGRELGEIMPLDAELTARLHDGVDLPLHRDIALGDGRYGIDISEIQLPGKGRIGYVVEWRDVTELRMNRALLHAIGNTQLVLEFSGQGQVSRANENVAQALGCDTADLLGQGYESLLKADDGSQGFWQRLQNLEPVIGRFRLAAHGGAEVIAEGSLTPVPDRSGEILKIVLIANNITAGQNALLRAQEENEAMLAAQNDMVEALRVGVNRLSSGDLRARIETVFPPEYEQLRRDFNAAMENLAQAMQVVIDNAQAIGGEAQEISNAASDLAQRTERQAATLAETATSLDQLTTSVGIASAGIGEADQTVGQMRLSAETSGQVVQQAVTAMDEIAESSRQISRIIGVIDDIAFQTNLLALNAGVEAARAGEAGRGFAVVASEVRALAQRSSEAAREIDTLISTSSSHVQRGVELVGETGTALEAILAAVNDVSERVSRIASSAREQSSGLIEINAAVIQLDQVTQQNAAMFEETTAASQALSQSVQSLNQTTARFQTTDAAISRAPAEASAPTRSAPVMVPRVEGSLALAPRTEADDWEDF